MYINQKFIKYIKSIELYDKHFQCKYPLWIFGKEDVFILEAANYLYILNVNGCNLILNLVK